MSADPILFRDLAYVFIAAVVGGALAWIARQPLVLGYVLGGLLISPLTPGPSVSDAHSFELFAEVGVVLLMFSVGIEFSLRDLQRVRWVALAGAPLGVLLTIGLGAGTGAVLGWPPLQGLMVGIVISVSSTMVLARLLMERVELHSRHGRVLIGISLVEDLAAVVLMVVLVVVGKLVLRAAVVWALGQPLSTSLLVGTGLAQIGEFSFVLVQVARSAGHISPEVYQTTLAASLITILLNAALFRVMEGWVGKLGLGGRRHRRELAVERSGLHDHVVLCGFGRVGSAIGEALESFGIRYLVIELDPDVIRGLAARGVPCLFGDAAHGRILEYAGVDRAALAVVTVPEADRARLAVQGLRRMRPDLPILARFHDAASRDGLLRAGADELIQPETEAAATLIRHALRRLELPQERILAYLGRFRGAMERAQANTGAAEALPAVEEVVMGSGPLADQTLGEARVRERLGVTVVAITKARGPVLHNPTADTVLRTGDRVRVFGLPDQLASFRREAGG